MADILIADDDPANLMLMQFVLEQQGGHAVRATDSAAGALLQLRVGEPDVLILDVAMPGMTGLELCRRLRRGGALPILVVSGLGAPADRVAGLRSGADDYLPKPFDPGELLERVGALLRRARRTATEPSGAVVHAGDLRLHLIDHLLWVRDREPVTLTPQECRLLYVMLSRPEAAWTRQDLLRRLWSASERGPDGGADVDASGAASAVESTISRLRQKMERVPHRPQYLVTVRGVGYKLCPAGWSIAA